MSSIEKIWGLGWVGVVNVDLFEKLSCLILRTVTFKGIMTRFDWLVEREMSAIGYK